MQLVPNLIDYDLQESEEVNGLLIDAVKAKLAVLDKLHN